MSAGEANATAAVALLDRILFKLAMTEEQDLEKVVKGGLPLVFSNLGGPYGKDAQVRNKAVEILTHVNKRVKERKDVKLPLEDLVQLFKEPSLSAASKNFLLIYLEMAFHRESPIERVKVLPQLITGLSKIPSAQANTLMYLVTSALPQLEVPNLGPVDPESPLAVSLRDPTDQKIVLEFFLESLQFLASSTPSVARPSTQPTTTPQSAASSEPEAQPPAPVTPMNGLSKNAIARVTNAKDPLTPEGWATRKRGIVRFLSDIFKFDETQLFLHMLIASCDSNHQVADSADTRFRRLTMANLEDPDLITRLFHLFLGCKAANEKDVRGPCTQSVRVVVAQQLCKSTYAANSFPHSLELIFHALFGAGTTLRMQQSGMEFALWVFREATDAKMKLLAPVVLSGMLKLLDGSIVAGPNPSDAKQIRSFAYTAIGLLGKRCPELFNTDSNIAILDRLFAAVYKEESSIRTAVQECLSSLSGAFTRPNVHIGKLIEKLILESARKDEIQARFVAVQWANQVFPFDNVTARMVCLMLCDDTNTSVKEEANIGLRVPPRLPDAPELPKNSKRGYPTFEAFIEYAAHRVLVDKPDVGSKVLPFSSKTHMQVLEFLHECLEDDAQHGLRTFDQELILVSGRNGAAMVYYQQMVEQCMDLGSADLVRAAGIFLLELMASIPSVYTKKYHPRIGWLTDFLKSASLVTREVAGQLIGYVGSDMSATDLESLLETFMSTITESKNSGRNLEGRHGATIALGFVIAKCLRRGVDLGINDVVVRGTGLLFRELEQPTGATATTLLCAACHALGVIGLCAPLPLPEREAAVPKPSELEGTPMDVDTPAKKETGSPVTKEAVIKRLVKLLNHVDVKVQERAATALGHISAGDRACFGNEIMEGLFNTARCKREELHFTIGQALACVAGCWFPDPFSLSYVNTECSSVSSYERAFGKSDILANTSSKRDLSLLDENDHEIMSKIIEEIVTKKVRDSSPVTRCSAAVWLLSLLQFSGPHSVIEGNLPRFQGVFSALVADDNDFTQEVASKGLSLIYGRGSGGMKKQLVEDLMSTFNTGRKIQTQATGTSEELSKDVVGHNSKAPSTYKELCGIANDMGKPEMIYKLMELSNHHTLWNSRKGAAFGFGSIMALGEDVLEPYMAVLVPKLYRYQYDPNPKIQESMSQIWRAVVKDPRKAAEKYFDSILEDLLKGMGNRQWRVREACCLAMADLLHGKTMEHVGPHLESIWTMAFRALDDIKETVRKAGEVASRTVGNLSVRLCNPDSSSSGDGKKAVGIVVPFMLNKGLSSAVSEIRAATIKNLGKITKIAGALLKPFVVEIIVAMLEAMSSLEPEAFNYLQFHTDSGDALEYARMKLATEGPLFETVENCIKHVDVAELTDLIPSLLQLIRTGVGLPTLTGCSHLIFRMSQTHPVDLRPYCPRLLKSLLLLLNDRSIAVRKTSASTIARVARLSENDIVQNLVCELRKFYITKEEEGEVGDQASRITSGFAFRAMTREASETLKLFLPDVLPLAFIARHDPHEDTQAVWKDVWDENAGSVSSTVTLYLEEFVTAAIKACKATSWLLKLQGALALRDLAEMSAGSLAEHLDVVTSQLLEALPGRIWDGKESLFKALESIGKHCQSVLKAPVSGSDTTKADRLVLAVVKEAKRPHIEYRRAAIDCLLVLLRQFPEVESFAAVHDAVVDLLDFGEGAPEKSKHDSELSASAMLILQSKTFDCLGNAWPANVACQGQHVETFQQLLVNSMPRTTWMVRLGILKALRRFLEVVDLSETVLTTSHMDGILSAIRLCYEDIKHTQVRILALDVVDTLLKRPESLPVLRHNRHALLADLRALQGDKEAKVQETALAMEKDIVEKTGGAS